MIRALVHDKNGTRIVQATAENLHTMLEDSAGFLWVDLPAGTSQELTPIGELFGFHPLAIEDALGYAEHPKVDDYGPYLHIVVHGLECDADTFEMRVLELDLFLGQQYLVTFHHSPLHCLGALWQRVLRDDRLLQRGPDGLAHVALDMLVDDLMPVLDKLDATIEDLEDEILANPSQQTLMRILDIKRATLQMRRTVVPEREVTLKLSRDASPLVQPKTQLYFRDVYDHLVRVTDINESLRDLVSAALEMYLSVASNRMNEIMKVLTLVTTVFMPLTLVAGIYGMNFRTMPELEWRYGYPAIVLGMVLLSAAMAYWFRRRGWM